MTIDFNSKVFRSYRVELVLTINGVPQDYVINVSPSGDVTAAIQGGNEKLRRYARFAYETLAEAKAHAIKYGEMRIAGLV